MKYFWVIGGGLLQVPLLETLRSMGINSIVSDASSDCICSNLCDLFVEIDIFDTESHIDHANKIISQGNTIIGVLAAGIDAPVTMSVLAEHLKLPCVDSEISKIVNNKGDFRRWMENNDIEMPKFKEFKNDEADKLTEYLDNIETPFIIKNVDSSASRGTKIFYVRDPKEELIIFDEACRVSRSDSCLVESVWQGTEHTVETFFDVEGNFHKFFITDRFFDLSSGFPVETGLRNPTSLSIEEADECYNLAERIANKLGIKIGAAKFDMIFTSEGPRVIEMTTRLSGGFDCQYLVPVATGQDILKMAIQTSLGKRFDPSLNHISVNNIGLTGSVWPDEGVIKSIEGVEEALELDAVKYVFLRKQVGDKIEHYNNCAQRACFIIVSAPTLDDADHALKEAQKLIKFTTT